MAYYLTDDETNHRHPRMLWGLYDLRIASGHTTAIMGRRIGVSASGYRKLEQGERELSIFKARALAQLLGCKIEDFFAPPFVNNVPYTTPWKDDDDET